MFSGEVSSPIGLLTDTEVGKDRGEEVVGSDFADDATEVTAGTPQALCQEVTADAEGDTLSDRLECSARFGECCSLTDVCR